MGGCPSAKRCLSPERSLTEVHGSRAALPQGLELR